MTFKYIVYTPMMKEVEFLSEVSRIIELLKKHNIYRVEMFYGWSWGEWEILETSVSEIENNIREQEQKTLEKFPGNDVLIKIPDKEIEILFCHEEDIHIEFNQVNNIVSAILHNWKAKKIVHCVRKNNVDIALSEIDLVD